MSKRIAKCPDCGAEANRFWQDYGIAYYHCTQCLVYFAKRRDGKVIRRKIEWGRKPEQKARDR